MKIYAISGLGADERVFEFLNLNHHIIPLPWIKHKTNETVESYAKRLSEDINTNEPYTILGVSFGGLVACEMAKFLDPVCTIIISSGERRSDLPWFFRLAGNLRLIKVVPQFMLKPPTWLACILFGTKRKNLIRNILKDTNMSFAKWAISELLTWQNKSKLINGLIIRGANDIFVKNKCADVLVNNGAHFMIVDKADEISDIINNHLKQKTAP